MPIRSPRLARTLPAALVAEPTVIVPGTAAFGRVLTGVAAQQFAVLTERADLAATVETTLETILSPRSRPPCPGSESGPPPAC